MEDTRKNHCQETILVLTKSMCVVYFSRIDLNDFNDESIVYSLDLLWLLFISEKTAKPRTLDDTKILGCIFCFFSSQCVFSYSFYPN